VIERAEEAFHLPALAVTPQQVGEMFELARKAIEKIKAN